MEPQHASPLFSPAATQRASEVIYDQIYRKIISGELRPGDRLPSERDLAAMFRRSRPCVREALQSLQQDGFLKITLGSTGGAIVQGISLKSVEDPLRKLVDAGAINLQELIDYRVINDRGCARLAARYHTEEDAALLKQIMADYHACVDDCERLRKIDLDFHQALAQASHNSLATLMTNTIAALNTNFFWDSVREKPLDQIVQINRKGCESHQAIVDAVLARDPDAAARAVGNTVDLFWESIQL